jgi:hypothetical protein
VGRINVIYCRFSSELQRQESIRDQATTDLEGLMEAVQEAFDQARESAGVGGDPGAVQPPRG